MTIGASDLFALGANFHEQSSTSNAISDMANIMDASGNIECETAIFPRNEYTAEYAYCNATPDIKTDLGAILTAFGDVKDSKVVTGVTINFTAGQYATVSVTGVQYDDAPVTTGINTADVADAVPASAGFGVPTMTGITAGATATPTGLTLTFSLNHVAAQGEDGAHFTSENITFRAEAAYEWLGVPTTPTPTGWTQDSYELSDSNSEHDTAAWNGHKHYDAA